MSKFNKKWFKHQENIDKLYKDLIALQHKQPEINLSKKIRLVGQLSHGEITKASSWESSYKSSCESSWESS